MDLVDVLNGLTDKREEVQERIADRRHGCELIAGAIVHFSNKFNRDVKDLVGRMLPRFTDGRYEHLKIDQDLKVRVFSNEKRNFMDLEEVSSGTQRQIMLAVRLALTKKLLSRTAKGKQFAFLDEPFAFFDEERTRRALQALAHIGDDISQVWIVAQDFPPDCEVQFDTRLICSRDSDTLVAST
jgi:exonuclease SbcC